MHAYMYMYMYMYVYDYAHVCYTNTTESPEPTEVGEITMKSRQRVRSASPSRLRATLKATQRLIMSRSARIRMRASVVVPGVSEGVLPPDAEPVTAQEALHHLAKMVREGERERERERESTT